MIEHTLNHIQCPACDAARPSEQPIHPSRNDVSQPLQDVPIAAQVFANYVFVPARRRPDGDTRPGGLHGSALLVFSDETAEKVQLRTGYAARVTRHAVLDAREDRSDEIVSGHKEAPPVADKVEMPHQKHSRLREFGRQVAAFLFVSLLAAALFFLCGGSIDGVMYGHWPESDDHPTNWLDQDRN
jgi:hypothetical protein